MSQPFPPPYTEPDHKAYVPTVRVTVPVRQDVLETFQRLAKAGSMSTGRAMGDWLADTLDAAQFMAEKMEQARAAPRIVAQEMHAYALGLADETTALMQRVKEKGRTARHRGAGARDAPGAGSAAPTPSPSCNTGGKVPPAERAATSKRRGSK